MMLIVKNLNSTTQELIGRTPSEIFGKEFFEKKMLPHAIRCMKSEVQVNYKTWFNFPSLGEKFMEITYYPYYGNGEKVVGFVVNARDITSQKKVERELVKAKDKAEENEQRISSIYDTVGDVIFHIKVESDKFRFISVNKEFLKATGLKESMIIGKLANEIIPANSLSMVLENYKKAINEKKTVRWIETSNYPTGQLIGQVSISPIFNDKGEATFLVGSVHDITELKEGERKLLLAKEKAEESDRLKTEFLNNMSHEIRTPMNGILGFSDMLSDPDLSVGKRANFIKIIQSSTNQLLQVIDDILEISRLGTQQVSVEEESVCINDLLLELFSIFDIKAKENKTPLYLKKTLSDKQSYIFVDKAKLIKILSNLLDNALKFTNYGFVEFGYHLKNYELELYIKDTGIGIEQANHELIFERFSQAEKDLTKKVGGLGLGLSIAKENTELIGGNIRLESKIDEGSTFFVTIPYKTVYKENKPNLEGADDQNEFTILIAEDEEVNYLYLETLLVDIFDLECKIVHVKNGVEAVEACKENKAIDLVLMDLKMPVLNGYEATEQIRAFNSKLPIIAQTAYSTSEERKQAIAAGCDDFLIKPIDKESLKEVIDKYLIKKIGI
ncbi:MAG: response regulator [Lutibacter sp.]|nr:response regulator [Lutibacter sp.]